MSDTAPYVWGVAEDRAFKPAVRARTGDRGAHRKGKRTLPPFRERRAPLLKVNR
ncbi:MAG: hypothetical protein LBK25_00060 [Treponema sp.]|nr:hypothetical protein [Treponema sp.]